jgi:hypothetical protein
MVKLQLFASINKNVDFLFTILLENIASNPRKTVFFESLFFLPDNEAKRVINNIDAGNNGEITSDSS